MGLAEQTFEVDKVTVKMTIRENVVMTCGAIRKGLRLWATTTGARYPMPSRHREGVKHRYQTLVLAYTGVRGM